MQFDTRSLLYALLAHALLVLLLFFAMDISDLELGGKKKVDTIETLIVDAPVMTTSERRRMQDETVRRQQKVAEEKRKKEEALRKLEAEKKRNAEAERKRKAEEAQKKAAALKKKKEAEAKKKAEAERKKKEAAENKRKDEERKKKEAAEKKRKAEEAAKRKAEEDKRKAQEALEAQMAAELAAEEEARRRAAEEKALQDQLRPVLSRWVAAMRNKVARNWLRPPGGADYFECSVFVKQLASGEVLQVKIEESCGSDVLNESVRKAVLKASPLPLPEDMRVFKKELIFVFKPD